MNSYSQEVLPKVWGKIKIVTPGLTLPSGILPGMEISLSGPGYNQSINTNNELEAALSSGEFYFRDVPTGISLVLLIKYKLPDDKIAAIGTSYTFSIPKINLRGIFQKERAYKIAGYTADFICNYPSGVIEWENRYE
jgi:hypothetical protein